MSLPSCHRSQENVAGEGQPARMYSRVEAWRPRKGTLHPPSCFQLPRFFNAVETFVKSIPLTGDMEAKEISGESFKRKWEHNNRAFIWKFGCDGKETSKSNG